MKTTGKVTDRLSVRVRRSAMNLLARREHSRRELTAKLRIRFSDEPDSFTSEPPVDVADTANAVDLSAVERVVDGQVSEFSINSDAAHTAAARVSGRATGPHTEHQSEQAAEPQAGQTVEQPVDQVIEEVLDQLETDGLLSDERFVEAYVHARTRRGFGPLSIRYDLRQRGIDADSIARWLPDDDEFWVAQLDQVLRRKYDETQLASKEPRTLQKIQRFLLSRGFSSSHWSQWRRS